MRRLVSAVVAAAGLVLAGIAPATAAGEIGVSRDGEHWSEALTERLFDPNARWVPGDVQTASFYVRNQGSSNARLVLTVRSGDRDELWSRGHVELRARTQGESQGQWVTLSNGRPAGELTQESLAPGSAVKIEVEADAPFDEDNPAENESQDGHLDLTFGLRLIGDNAAGTGRDSDNATGSRQDADRASGSDGWLAHTGAPASALWLWLAAAATAVGTAFVVAGRQEEKGREKEEGDA
ncbi:hypothetical protein [Aeromicrobium duanguangcaii]|uniref:Uncharacterized protein n=1 Tax=Aeromicrobium duanguangcaii TaxID=2968086 RepID=A0ABY5KH53_9ACTN|nr:hypothetical protein [Aeromicrobium duanguangcaii]MCD9153087.1 hypothetical protein [Aeromicrobium duanguangcaii]MCL3836918.1 hypothetical protein [Aeromicrobium duanguangcaii]UUI69811.1 hypothetical protein NP095_06875 [Aeromicrobium duanguangcaii]